MALSKNKIAAGIVASGGRLNSYYSYYSFNDLCEVITAVCEAVAKAPDVEGDTRIPIDSDGEYLHASVRNALFAAGIVFVEQLEVMTPAQVLELPHIGRTGLSRIQHYLGTLSRRLAPNMPKKKRQTTLDAIGTNGIWGVH